MAIPLDRPPRTRTAAGAVRRVGVEIEFAGIEPEQTARLVQDLYGGRIEEFDRHKFAIAESGLGEFVVELDASYVHPDHRPPDASAGLEAGIKAKLGAIRERLAPTIGDVVSLWLPYEVVAPPIAYDRLPELDRLVETLRAHHAKGTRDSLVYSFGLQLNPEVASTDADDLRRHVQAYLVLSAWLRAEIDVDPTRRLMAFAHEFPRSYVEKVLSPDYRPDLAALIDDYLEDNPSRNRELDLLPLFAHIDPDRVHRAVADPLIKSRPTFHYRLPNSRVDEPGWGGVIEEWNRWVKVERLAADERRLNEALHASRTLCHSRDDWVEQSHRWVID